jgi:hypothetical protein
VAEHYLDTGRPSQLVIRNSLEEGLFQDWAAKNRFPFGKVGK